MNSHDFSMPSGRSVRREEILDTDRPAAVVGDHDWFSLYLLPREILLPAIREQST